MDNRPVDAPSRDVSTGGFQGNHRSHLTENAGPAECAVCHPGSDSYTSSHRDGRINISSRINASPVTTAYNNLTTAFSQTPTPILGRCTNVNCHFESETPDWGSPPLASGSCSVCHGAPPSDGAHGKKHGEYFGTGVDSCSRCHNDHTAEGNPLAHAFSAGKRALDVRFAKSPNSGGAYSGDISYPGYLPSQNPPRNGVCTNLYCHSDAVGRAPVVTPRWSDTATTKCYSCHRGRSVDNTPVACAEVGGTWNDMNGICTPYVNMTSNGHGRLVGPQWIRKYPCTFCHNATVDVAGNIKDKSKHVNGINDVLMAPQWAIVGKPAPSYDPATKVCDNVYCHSDGTTTPGAVKPFAWTERKTDCNTCHGHPNGACDNAGCHDGRTDSAGKFWPVRTGWPAGDEWKAAIPMFQNEGPGTARANSHPRHTETTFTCDQCHGSTIINGTCTDCHATGIPPGKMSEYAHLNADYHVNRTKDVVFRKGGSYNSVTKRCSNTACHTGGTDPIWGESVNNAVICLSCHSTTEADVDSFGFFVEGLQTKINLAEWATTGHGRPASAGPYPASGNPAANFPGNPCWYCHDNNVLHKDASNPFRLRKHSQFVNRFEEECVYCHMVGDDSECLGCHYSSESLAIQITNASVQAKHNNMVITSGCRAVNCHDTDARLHNSGAGFWTPDQKADVRNQYMMMGVCLQCHDDDSGGKCTSCHAAPPDKPFKYSLGFDPGTGFVKAQKARASSSHFGYKHYRAFENSGGWTKDVNGKSIGAWKGGKFCWDCHDPHGDSNIYMVQSQVATSTDGTFGIPRSRAAVVFARKQSGLDYVKTQAPYNGICNVCHSAGSQHFRSDGGDGHNISRVCTKCHEHRFSDSHADGQACNTCHLNKPVPRHSGFGLPKDCTKCHEGTVGKRMDVMGQFGGTSHHVQGVEVSNKHCYTCHWESNPDGLIDVTYHEGYNFKTYSTVKNAKVDLVVWGPGTRPAIYRLYTTAVQFLASNIGTVNERTASASLNTHCLSCHNDQNNDTQPFGDCKTPRQYAWDKQSIASRYSQVETALWGKYNSATLNVTKKDAVTKALSAHGNAVANQGGWSLATGLDASIPNTRNGTQNVQCFDCHSSHGSKLVGVTSSYVTFNGTKNGGNLKETQAGKGGYQMSYKATSYTSPGAPNPYNAGAGQCFDCHMTQTAGTTPWGYQSTFGASEPIKGYLDSDRFGMGANGCTQRFPFKEKPVKAGHLLSSSPLANQAMGAIDGLCTPCHDPHGVSQSLGAKKAYAVPLLKGTWLTSPYKEDGPQTSTSDYQNAPTPNVFTDQRTFGGGRIAEDDTKFAGLCLRCHPKASLTDGVNKNQPWKSLDRVHESVKGWGANTEHSYPCSKCHAPHVTSLPRLMHTNCLDYKHRGRVASGGWAGAGSGYGSYGSGSGSFPRGSGQSGVNCHPSGAWPDNYWNVKTPW